MCEVPNSMNIVENYCEDMEDKFVSIINDDDFPENIEWLGFWDSRDFMDDKDDDFFLKHFFLETTDVKIHLSTTDELMGEKNGDGYFEENNEFSCNWLCNNKDDANILREIAIKNLGKLSKKVRQPK